MSVQDDAGSTASDHGTLAAKLSRATGAHFNHHNATMARQLLQMLAANSTLVFDAAYLSRDEEVLDVMCAKALLEAKSGSLVPVKCCVDGM